MAQDIFQLISSLDAEGVQRIIGRLEFRGNDENFIAMREEYLGQMNFAKDSNILDLGCGTGVVARALASRESFSGNIVGVDFSPELIDAAQLLAKKEGFDKRIQFRVGDAAALEDDDESFDAVILHTLISHVPDPVAVISEASRVARRGSLIAIFDGDYASLTYATGDHKLDAEMVSSILDAIVANPYVMRELPSILKDVGLEINSGSPHILAEAGTSTFFSSVAESYVPMVIRSQTAPEAKANGWLDAYRETASTNTSFASCNYFTYLARRPL